MLWKDCNRLAVRVKSWDWHVFSIHMFICLWSGSFALSIGNPTAGPAAFPAPGRGETQQQSMGNQRRVSAEHSLIASAAKVRDGEIYHCSLTAVARTR